MSDEIKEHLHDLRFLDGLIERQSAELIERLVKERDEARYDRDQFIEQLASRERTALEQDMQEIMRINNALWKALNAIAPHLRIMRETSPARANAIKLVRALRDHQGER